MQPQISEHSEIIDIFAIVSQIAAEVPYNTHHLDHIFRVLKLSQDILKHEPADKMIVEAAACLHDLGRFFDDDQDRHEVISSSKAREILSGRQWERTVIEKVCYAIETHRFSKLICRKHRSQDPGQRQADALSGRDCQGCLARPDQSPYDLMNPNSQVFTQKEIHSFAFLRKDP